MRVLRQSRPRPSCSWLLSETQSPNPAQSISAMPCMGWREEPALSGQRIEESLPPSHQGHGSLAAGSAERRLGAELCTAMITHVHLAPCDGRCAGGYLEKGFCFGHGAALLYRNPQLLQYSQFLVPRMLQYSQFLAARERSAIRKQFLKKHLCYRLTAAKGRQPSAFPGHSAALCTTAAFHTPLTSGLSPSCAPAQAAAHLGTGPMDFQGSGAPGYPLLGSQVPVDLQWEKAEKILRTLRNALGDSSRFGIFHF